MVKNSLILLFLATVATACGRPYNSSSADALRYGSTVDGSADFQVARIVMVNKCFSCHGGWAAYSEADFIANNLVAARSLTNSKLYYRLRGNDTGITGDMPPSENLSTEELNYFETWILGIN